MSKKTMASGVATKNPSRSRSLTKAQMVSQIAGATGLTRTQVQQVFDSLFDTVRTELTKGRKNEEQAVTIPRLCKIVSQPEPAQKELRMINPYTGKETIFKASPGRRIVQISVLKELRDVV